MTCQAKYNEKAKKIRLNTQAQKSCKRAVRFNSMIYGLEKNNNFTIKYTFRSIT